VCARNLRRGRTGFIALVVPELTIPYFGELAALIITAIHRREWNVLIRQTRGNRDSERATLDSLGPHLVDGDEDLSAHNLGVPIVMLGEHALDVEIDRIAIDNVLAARTAVTHLLELGRRRMRASATTAAVASPRCGSVATATHWGRPGCRSSSIS
jgi:DNA-binding LacI/PurR family transcriptional regulator